MHKGETIPILNIHLKACRRKKNTQSASKVWHKVWALWSCCLYTISLIFWILHLFLWFFPLWLLKTVVSKTVIMDVVVLFVLWPEAMNVCYHCSLYAAVYKCASICPYSTTTTLKCLLHSYWRHFDLIIQYRFISANALKKLYWTVMQSKLM